MEFLQNPNVVYLLLAGGLMFAVLALAAPGTGVLELSSLFILGVAGWSVVYYNIAINWWAVVILAGGTILFVFAIFKAKTWSILGIAVVAIAFGSAFLFRGSHWYAPAVHPVLAIGVAILTSGFFWIVGRKSIQAASVRPTHDLTGLIGKIGEAKTHIHDQGTVQVGSELWSSRSEIPIRIGQHVRVIGREGFTLLVEPLQPDKIESQSV